jgi:predicted DCC family thiol-disulfide oxidoreductase YuxK
MHTQKPVLLYDGVCGFCNKTVQFILKHDRNGTILFSPLQGEYAKSVLQNHPEARNVDSLILSEPDRVSTRSTGALRVASYLGGIFKLALIGYIVPRFIRDAFYDWFARHRYSWFGKYDTCQIPSKEQRARFLD